MLKVIPPTTNCGGDYFKMKCAEIHYQTASFSILCIFCGISLEHYTDFVDHFHSCHFEEFAKNLPKVTAVFTSSSEKPQVKPNDPLEFEDKEWTEAPNELIEMFENHVEEVALKIELQEGYESCGKNIAQTIATKEERDSSSSDEEPLICKIERVEQLERDSVKLKKSQRSRRSVSQNGDKSGSELNCNISNLTLNGQHSEKEEHVNNHEPTTDEEDKDVDWTKPYQPNLLRNHEKRPYKPRNKPNSCSFCGRTFRRRYQLDTHLNIHTGLKPHQCDICGRQFRAVTTLTRHLTTHEQREVFQCKFCEKMFTHKAALLSHESRHTQERSVPCDECEKLFYTANQMDTHKRKVHHKADQALPFACDICAKRYRSRSMLSTHKFKKHYKTAKFCCEQCDKKFVDEKQLENHRLIHVSSLSNAEAV